MSDMQGTILRVDLGSGKIEKEPLGKDLRLKYVGGRGINSRLARICRLSRKYLIFNEDGSVL